MKTEFFGVIPPEHHQQYLDAVAKLREANTDYWKARIELFEMLQPLFQKERETLRKELTEVRKELEENPESDKKIREQEIVRQLNSGPLNVDYRAVADEESNRYELRYIQRANLSFRPQTFPMYLEPDKKSEFWHAFAKESIFLCETTAEYLKQRAETHKKQVAEFPARLDEIVLEELPYDIRSASFFRAMFMESLPLNDEQKKRIANDEHLFLVRNHDVGFSSPRFDDFKFLIELRNAELEPWKLDATPELAKLGITQEEVARWDGSYSLHPLIRAVAERIEGIDTTLLQTPYGIGVMQTGYGTRIGVEAKATTLSGMPLHPEPRVRITGGMNVSSSVTQPVNLALPALIQGEKDVIFLTQLSKTEIDDAKKKNVELVSIPFAKDAIVFLQNRYNPVRSLTQKQYQGIFGGQHKNWKEFDGFDGDIQTCLRYDNPPCEQLIQTLLSLDDSVYDAFKSRSYDGITGTIGGTITNSIGRDVHLEMSPGAIAYSTYHYDRYLVPSVFSRMMRVNDVFPNAETIASGEYPLVYECVLVHRKEPGEKVERLVK